MEITYIVWFLQGNGCLQITFIIYECCIMEFILLVNQMTIDLSSGFDKLSAWHKPKFFVTQSKLLLMMMEIPFLPEREKTTTT